MSQGGDIMTREEVKYCLKVIRKGYKNISAPYGAANFVMIILLALFAFLLLVYETVNEWHTTDLHYRIVNIVTLAAERCWTYTQPIKDAMC